MRPLRAAPLRTIAALGLCLAAPAGGQATSEPVASVIEWLGQHIRNDTIPSSARVEWCEKRRQTATVADVGTECESILAGRKPRDTTVVLFVGGDSLERIFATAANLPYRIVADTGTCPWPTPEVANVGFRLRVRASLIGQDSALVRVRRTCHPQPKERSRGVYFAEFSYYLARVPGGWRIERIIMSVT